MAWFEKEFIAFFLELEVNNHKEWFHENKKRYEQYVKEPFYNFVAEMIKRINKDDPSIAIEPKEAIFRINRDIRFSKDKQPYKNYYHALVRAPLKLCTHFTHRNKTLSRYKTKKRTLKFNAYL